MNEKDYFEQFAGDVPYHNPWHDKGIGSILFAAGIQEFTYQWTGNRCDFVTSSHSEDDVLSRLNAVAARYHLAHINTYKPEWITTNETHGHFNVDLKKHPIHEI